MAVSEQMQMPLRHGLLESHHNKSNITAKIKNIDKASLWGIVQNSQSKKATNSKGKCNL